ncbi:HAD family hydrolase [Ancylobacter sp. 6x-1]|uniref:HAD family hydrolase n=1 Tax=Ancylobacter crimeensis TaxID=2579147 RepID=A0ABT0D7A2_9HYPH|nr:HAD family hydrolase [Ancylobacter crimeensis]MCK0195837.1 HAD family hydrolase [Ancylobacter crimeensis]
MSGEPFHPALVIFDCDGVLIDSEVISARALIAELAGHGVVVDLPFVARHFIGRAFPVILSDVAARFAVTLPPGFEEAYRTRLLAAFEAELEVMEGAAETVAALAVPFCLATSSSPARLARSLAISGLAPLFAGRSFTSSEVARGKPAPDLFLHAAARMGVDPAACLVVEDSAAGVEAGRRAGMRVWHFTGGSHMAYMPATMAEPAAPHRSVASFKAFRAQLPGLFQEETSVTHPVADPA